MDAEDKIEILKFILMVISAIFVILGMAIFGCGVWILFDESNFIGIISSVESVKFIAGGFFVIGLVVVAVGLLGCLGALKEIKCFLLLYMALLIVILFGEVIVTIIILTDTKKITKALSEEVDRIIAEYGNGTEHGKTEIKWDIIDNMQHYWKCCGRTKYTQWKNNIYVMSHGKTDVYPCSCFNTTTCPFLTEDLTRRFGQGESVYDKGCQTRIEEWIQQNALVMLAMDLGLVFIQVFLIVLCVSLFRNITQKAKNKHEKLKAPMHLSAINAAFQDLD